MSLVSILVLSVFWATSSAYVMYYHNKHYTLGLDMIIGAIILGPVLMFLVGRDVDEKKKYYGVMEDNNRRMDETHRRWFDLHNRINRERTPNWFRTIPPPPPISRIEQAQSERDEAIRSAIERIDKNKLKDFKFLSSNVKDTE
jgi:hypothetical protein